MELLILLFVVDCLAPVVRDLIGPVLSLIGMLYSALFWRF